MMGVALLLLSIIIAMTTCKVFEGVHRCVFKSPIKSSKSSLKRSDDIYDHPIFKRFDIVLTDKIPKLKKICQPRKMIFLQLLEIKIKNVKENFEELMHVNINDVSSEIFKIHILTLLNNTTIMFYKKTFDNDIDNNIVNRFEKKLYPTKELIEALICHICDDHDWYATNLDKLYSILDLISAYEAYSIAEIECVVNESYPNVSSPIYEGTASSSCALNADFESLDGARHEMRVAPAASKNSSKTVLYIEDNIGSASIIAKGLAKFDAYVINAKTVMEALELLDKITVDVAIIDYNLPDMPGTCLEESLSYYKIPFLYYTAMDAKDIKTNAKILPKPYNLTALNNELDILIDVKKKELIRACLESSFENEEHK